MIKRGGLGAAAEYLTGHARSVLFPNLWLVETEIVEDLCDEVRLGHVDVPVFCAFNVDTKKVANISLIRDVKSCISDGSYGGVDVVAVRTGQNAVVGVKYVDCVSPIE